MTIYFISPPKTFPEQVHFTSKGKSKCILLALQFKALFNMCKATLKCYLFWMTYYSECWFLLSLHMFIDPGGSKNNSILYDIQIMVLTFAWKSVKCIKFFRFSLHTWGDTDFKITYVKYLLNIHGDARYIYQYEHFTLRFGILKDRFKP